MRIRESKNNNNYYSQIKKKLFFGLNLFLCININFFIVEAVIESKDSGITLLFS